MTFGKAAGLSCAFLAAVALGVGISPYVIDHPAATRGVPVADVDISASDANAPAPVARRAAPPALPAMAASSAVLHERIKPLLNKGADMTLASAAFTSGEQFAAVAHAARNTEIPFMLLRHRVLVEGKSLADAISESRPDVNARIEAERAVAEARSDIAALQG